MPTLVLLAWALRLYRSGRQSLTADEIATLQAARSPDLTAFLQSHAGLDHPPLYFIFERLWVGLAGTSEFSLRFPSAVAGLLTVAMLYQVGRLAAGPRMGATAAVLVACSPFGVFFGQEARGYTFMLLGLTLCLWLALRLAKGAGDRWWVGWGAAAGLTSLTMYVAVPALGAMALYLTWLARRQRRWASWRWCVLAGGLLFGAWAANANPLAGVYSTAGDLTPRADLLAVLTRGAGAAVVGAFLPEPWLWVAALPFLAVLLVGAMGAPTDQRWLFGGTVVVCVVVVTVAAVDRLGFHARYLLPALPAAYLLAARGSISLLQRGRVVAVVTCLLVLLPMGWAVRNVYFDQTYARADFRAAAAFVTPRYRPGDIVVFNAPWAKAPFAYYAGGTFESVGLPDGAPPDAPATQQQLDALAARYDRIWLVRWQDWFTDPQRTIRTWLDDRLPKFVERQLPFITVEGYLARPSVAPVVDSTTHPYLFDFEGKLRLATVEVDTSGVADQGRLTVSVDWLSLGPSVVSYKVFVHLVDGNGTLVAQRDREPVFGLLPTTRWQPNTLVQDDYDIVLPELLPEGPYHLNLGWYLENGPRLEVTGAAANHARVASNLWLKR